MAFKYLMTELLKQPDSVRLTDQPILYLLCLRVMESATKRMAREGKTVRESQRERDGGISVNCAANISVPVLFLLCTVRRGVLAVINVWLVICGVTS